MARLLEKRKDKAEKNALYFERTMYIALAAAVINTCVSVYLYVMFVM